MRTLGEPVTLSNLNDPAAPGVQSGVMNDPIVSIHASPSGATVERAAVFENFFREQSPNLYARLCLITGDGAEAEELSQDAFLRPSLRTSLPERS